MINSIINVSDKSYQNMLEETSSCDLAWETTRLSKAASILFGDADNGPTLLLTYNIIIECETLVLCELGRRYIKELNLD